MNYGAERARCPSSFSTSVGMSSEMKWPIAEGKEEHTES